MDPSTTRTNGSSSPRSALKNHSMKSFTPPTGPLSKSMSGQWTPTLGSPGRAPRAISSMLGWVAAVSATESPSQERPALIQRMWTTGSSAGFVAADFEEGFAVCATRYPLFSRTLIRGGNIYLPNPYGAFGHPLQSICIRDFDARYFPTEGGSF